MEAAGSGIGTRHTANRRRWRKLPFLLTAVLAGYISDSPGIENGSEYKEWSERLVAAAGRHDAAEEVLDLNTIGHRWSWALSTLPPQLIEQAAADAERARIGAARLELYQLLYDIRWQRPDGTEPSRWWLQLSLDLLTRNQPQQAVAVAAHITDPYELIAVQADKRYARIAGSELIERDILKATREELERRRVAAAKMPRELRRLVQVGRLLLALRRYDEVLQLTDSVIERADAAAPQSSAFDDLKRELPWILELRFRVSRALGRYDEGLDFLRRACKESQDDPVSHSLHLAIFLAELGRPREALAAIPPLDRASRYGRAIAAQARVMATAELDDAAGLESALSEVRAASEEDPQVRQHALITAGRDDEAAAVLVSRLADPDQRADALMELQDYADSPVPALVLAWRGRAKALRNRPEVRRAIAAYGRIRNYPLPATDF